MYRIGDGLSRARKKRCTKNGEAECINCRERVVIRPYRANIKKKKRKEKEKREQLRYAEKSIIAQYERRLH